MAVSTQTLLPLWKPGYHSHPPRAPAPQPSKRQGEERAPAQHDDFIDTLSDQANEGRCRDPNVSVDCMAVNNGPNSAAADEAQQRTSLITEEDGEVKATDWSDQAVKRRINPLEEREDEDMIGKADEDDDGGVDEDEEEEEEEKWSYPEDPLDGSYGVDRKDEGTADEWVPRHPEMIRLTGRHPFNSEPPIHRLMQHGFLTPTSLHYVRNHGQVPEASRSCASYHDWHVEVCGLVQRPQRFTVAQLIEELPAREVAATLVCAGNRRKEVNMVRQTKGFNWGPGAVATSVWRGARLCDVLRRCGVALAKWQRGSGSPLFVRFRGAETLPGDGASGEGNFYGTSIPLSLALDESRDILLAYLQNGQPLSPDHGFPVRAIIPGFIGGRMVKWLTQIEVSTHESNSHYHFKDNRLLPSHVDIELANSEGWWYKPDYLINELNINSVITSPSHGEVIPINPQTPYLVKGYAYSGGGRKVIRVEVSLNEGQSWNLAKVTHPEKPTKYGKHWCWCFWEVELHMLELLQAKEMFVRAWDASMNTQPQHLNWNTMGFMNNCWYRVKINPCKTKSTAIGLAFEHPIRPGNQSGGWMSPSTSQDTSQSVKPKQTLGRSPSTPSLHHSSRMITNAELKKHNTPESPWIAIHNFVYDCTKFLNDHPGGKSSILINAGCDCTEDFDAIHSVKAKAMLEDYKIGELVMFGGASSDTTPEHSLHGGNKALSALSSLSSIDEPIPARPVALNPRKKIQCRLIAKKFLSLDVRLFRFALPRDDQVLGLPVGKHVFISAQINGKLCMRAYTPVSSNKEEGYFELMVKVYFKGVNEKFPKGGLMSQHLESLQIGDFVDVKGPLGHIEYVGKGCFHVDGNAYNMKRCAMIAGGTGITPMYQLIREILEYPTDETELHLIFANRKEEDIMLRMELDDWAKKYSQFKIWYVLSSPPKGWQYGCGHINEEVIRLHFPLASNETSVFLCGPTPMIEEACMPNLERLGFDKNLIFTF